MLRHAKRKCVTFLFLMQLMEFLSNSNYFDGVDKKSTKIYQKILFSTMLLHVLTFVHYGSSVMNILYLIQLIEPLSKSKYFCRVDKKSTKIYQKTLLSTMLLRVLTFRHYAISQTHPSMNILYLIQLIDLLSKSKIFCS